MQEFLLTQGVMGIYFHPRLMGINNILALSINNHILILSMDGLMGENKSLLITITH